VIDSPTSRRPSSLESNGRKKELSLANTDQSQSG